MSLPLLARALEALEWSSAALSQSPRRAEDVARVSGRVARAIRAEVAAELRGRSSGSAGSDEPPATSSASPAATATSSHPLDRFAEELEEHTRAVRSATRRDERA